MVLSIVGVTVGLFLLALGAEGLVRGSSSLALRIGVTPLVIGLTVVAIGTSAPELAVCVSAALEGNSAIALGNIVGSNIANIGLILAIAAIIRPIPSHPQVLWREVPTMIGVTLVLWAMLLDGEISQLDGALLLAGGIAYIAWTYFAARVDKEELKEITSQVPRAIYPVWIDLAMAGVGLGALILGARWLVDGVVAIAEMLYISPVMIALSVVAVGTSLPELATSIAASVKGAVDISVGNVVGSNLLNILVILGATALVHPIHARDLRALDLSVMILFAMALLPLMLRKNHLTRAEGVVMLLIYLLYIGSLAM